MMQILAQAGLPAPTVDNAAGTVSLIVLAVASLLNIILPFIRKTPVAPAHCAGPELQELKETLEENTRAVNGHTMLVSRVSDNIAAQTRLLEQVARDVLAVKHKYE